MGKAHVHDSDGTKASVWPALDHFPDLHVIIVEASGRHFGTIGLVLAASASHGDPQWTFEWIWRALHPILGHPFV